MSYDLIKKNYDRGLWTAPMVAMCVRKGLITTTQYNTITGLTYSA